MSESLSYSLQKVARGSVIAMAGILLGLFSQFIAWLIVARYGLEAGYGVFSLAMALLTFAMMLASLGLQLGSTRYIAYFTARNDHDKVRRIISVTLKLPTAISIIISIALFFSAEAIALQIFHIPDLAQPLKLFAIGVPFFTLINIIAAIFRGFGRVEPHAFFQFILLNVLFLLFLLIIVLLELPFVIVFYGYLASLILTFVALLLYTFKKLPQAVLFTSSGVDISIVKGLLLFSLPLMGATFINTLLFYIDTLLLGFFRLPETVGLLNAAYPLVLFIFIPLHALSLIYMPVTAGLYSQNLMAELRQNYTVLTKWLVSVTLPIFLVLCLFPESVLNLVFGPAYVSAALALRILSLGFIFSNLIGLSGVTLVAMGESRFIAWSLLSATLLNVLVSIVLIPALGLTGAAIAFSVSWILLHSLYSVRLYLLYRAQPFSKNLLKPLIVSIVLAFLFQFLLGCFLTVTWWMLPLLFILYYAMYGTITMLTRSFDDEDIALLLQIEKGSGISVAPIKKLVRRFL
jgi:O-antigen/teichoic acid export membrane protein